MMPVVVKTHKWNDLFWLTQSQLQLQSATAILRHWCLSPYGCQSTAFEQIAKFIVRKTIKEKIREASSKLSNVSSFHNTRQIACIHCKSAAAHLNIVRKESLHMVPTKLEQSSNPTKTDFSKHGAAFSVVEYTKSMHPCLLTERNLVEWKALRLKTS